MEKYENVAGLSTFLGPFHIFTRDQKIDKNVENTTMWQVFPLFRDLSTFLCARPKNRSKRGKIENVAGLSTLSGRFHISTVPHVGDQQIYKNVEKDEIVAGLATPNIVNLKRLNSCQKDKCCQIFSSYYVIYCFTEIEGSE